MLRILVFIACLAAARDCCVWALRSERFLGLAPVLWWPAAAAWLGLGIFVLIHGVP